MAGQALRTSVGPDYRNALGLAAWVFVELEWNAVNVADRIEKGFIYKVEKMTAGVIAKELTRIVETLPDSPDKVRLRMEAKNFKDLVAIRNDLMHAGPAADPNNGGASTLYRKHAFLNIEFLKKAADDFFDCSAALNAELYGFLKVPD